MARDLAQRVQNHQAARQNAGPSLADDSRRMESSFAMAMPRGNEATQLIPLPGRWADPLLDPAQRGFLALDPNHAALRRVATKIADSAAGVTPAIRPACPKVPGRAASNRSTISADNPPIAR